MKGIHTLRAVSALGLAIAAIAVSAAQPTRLVFWNFNVSNPTDPTSILTPTELNVSSARIDISGASFIFDNNGTGFVGSPLDPGTDGRDWALQTSNYPDQGQNPGTAGIQVYASTAGYQNIVVKFDVRWSNTASKFLRVDYSVDNGATWTELPGLLEARQGDAWHGSPEPAGYGRLVEIALPSLANDKQGFAFRVVTVFAPGSSEYAAAQSGRSYTTRGTLRYDLIEVRGTLRGDVNSSGCVDDADLLQVLFSFGQTGSNPADVNGDQVVDDADLLIVLFNFGQGCGG